MPFYTFNQNNSGGFYKGPALYVIVEADAYYEANLIAEDNGVYFDGIEKDIDCSCCGNRWYRTRSYNETNRPEISGEPVGDSPEHDFRDFIIIYKSNFIKRNTSSDP